MFMRRNVLFENRKEAGVKLADNLGTYRGREVVVLGIPRGGIPVAVPVAERLKGKLDVIVVKKLGAPGNPELAIGAVGESGETNLNDELVSMLGIDEEYLVSETKKQHQRVKELAGEFRSVRDKATLEDRTVILVDDGIATGATTKACLEIIRQENPTTIVLAIPVAPTDTLQVIRRESLADDIICLHEIDGFFGGIGGYYAEFGQVSSKTVQEALKRFRQTGDR